MSIFSPPSTTDVTPTGDLVATLFIGALSFFFIFALVDYLATWLTGYASFKALISTQLNDFWAGSAALLHLSIYVKGSTTLNIINYTALVTSVTASVVLGWLFHLSTVPAERIHLAGRERLEGNNAIKKWKQQEKKEEEWGGKGIPLILCPSGEDLYISDQAETKHCLYIAGTGGGKTTVLRPRIDAARARGDQVLIYDNKSDFTSSLDDVSDVILIAPWDSRGWKWDVAADIQNRTDATAFAASLIIESKDPMWANAARNILTAIFIRGQKTAPGKWDFGFVCDIIFAGSKEIRATVEQFAPEYLPLIDDLKSKTTQGILINLLSYLEPVLLLNDAWSRCKVKGKFSIKNWIHQKGKEANLKTIIIQGNGEVKDLQTAVTQAVLGVITREVTSPKVTDSKDRHISLFLDEFPQLGKLEGFDTLVVVGRSKGVRLSVAIQDVAQLKEIYGDNVTNTWLSSFGTYIIGMMNGGETVKYLTDFVGKEKIRRYQPSFSNDGQNAQSRTDQYVEEEVDVMRREEWSTVLGYQGDSMRMCVLTGDNYAYLVDAIDLTSEEKSEKRPPNVPARWTQGDWPSSDDIAKSIADKEEAKNEKEA